MLAATGGESEGRLGWSGRPEAETAQAAQHMCRRRLARRSRCVENCVVTLGRKRLEGGANGVWRVTGAGGVRLDSPKYNHGALKESKYSLYIWCSIVNAVHVRVVHVVSS